MKEFSGGVTQVSGSAYYRRWLDFDDSPQSLLTINFKCNNSALRLFSTLTTFGTAQDVALQQLRIESFFPADEATRTALTAA